MKFNLEKALNEVDKRCIQIEARSHIGLTHTQESEDELTQILTQTSLESLWPDSQRQNIYVDDEASDTSGETSSIDDEYDEDNNVLGDSCEGNSFDGCVDVYGIYNISHCEDSLIIIFDR